MFLKNYLFYELSTDTINNLPHPPSNKEKLSYTKKSVYVLIFFSTLSLVGLTISSIKFFSQSFWLYGFFILLFYTIVYFFISLNSNLLGRSFDLKTHRQTIRSWKPKHYPSVDIFLPTCGEPISILKNTWLGVSSIKKTYSGKIVVYSLDDAHSDEVRKLSEEFGFVYYRRPNKGWFKKAGNLRYGFENSSGDFIVIFDADFVPRNDFLSDLLPYFFKKPNLGIIQTPQYFDVSQKQNWLERGAGAVQEFFYRTAQTSRQQKDGAICVGSNAIYRRKSLQEIGGTALIEHSEDVHTGFSLRRKNWHILYLPIVLAKGLCPYELKGFFKQQYRWCMGSLSLLVSKVFWQTKLPLKTRLCYISGFMYYIHTAIYSIITPSIPLIMLLAFPEKIKLINYLLIFPSVFYIHIVLPLWHKKQYGIETSSVKIIYGWAHLFAGVDRLMKKSMEWQPTGAVHKKDKKYNYFKMMVLFLNFLPSVLWVSLAYYYMYTRDALSFLPMYLLGFYYLFSVLKVVLYKDPKIF
jgi:cellulose synthase (UDP-forming)